jgi:hypothetical protein
MTRKDYKQFANLLAEDDAGCEQVIGDIEWGMIRIFAADKSAGGVVP